MRGPPSDLSFAAANHHSRLLADIPAIKKIRNITRNRKNRNLAIPAAVAAMPVNPNSASTTAIIKKRKAQRNIISPPQNKFAPGTRAASIFTSPRFIRIFDDGMTRVPPDCRNKVVPTKFRRDKKGAGTPKNSGAR
jgi:hypothetical protein